MPNREQLIEGLRKADAAGDTAAAQRFAELIRGMGAEQPQTTAPAGEAPNAAVAFIQRAGQTVPFVQQGASALAALVDPARQEPTFGERYTAAREALKQRAAAASAAHPLAGALGTGAGIAGQIAAAAPEAVAGALANPVASARALASLPAAVPDAIGALSSALVHLGRGGGAALAPVARAAAQGGLAAAGLSEADIPLAQGRFGEALRKLGVDVGQGAVAGAAAGALGQGALARNERLAEAAANSEPARRLAAADVLDEHTAAVRQAEAARDAVRAANQRATADARAANTAARQGARAADEAAFQRARQMAERQARAVSERNALPILGLEGKQRLLGKDAAVAGREARRLFNTPVPGEGITYGQALGSLPEDQAFQLVQKTRKGLGEGLGQIREQIAGSGETVPVSAVLASVDDALAPLERETKQRAGALVRRIVQRALPPVEAPPQLFGPGGQPLPAREVPQTLNGAQLRKVIEDIQDSTHFGRAFGDDGDRVLWAAYDGATKLERAMAGRIDPALQQRYEGLNQAYRDAVRVEAGAGVRLGRAQAAPNHPSLRNPPVPVRRADLPRTPVPAPVVPVKQPLPAAPAFPRTDPRVAAVIGAPVPHSSDAEVFRAVRDAAFQPESTAGARATGRAVGGALGAGIGYGLGGFAGAAGGGEVGRRTGEALVRQFFRTAQPTRETLEAGALLANRAISDRLPLLEAAVRGGPAAVNAIHRTLMKTDPEYRTAVEGNRTTQRQPVSGEEFFGEFRGQ